MTLSNENVTWNRIFADGLHSCSTRPQRGKPEAYFLHVRRREEDLSTKLTLFQQSRQTKAGSGA